MSDQAPLAGIFVVELGSWVMAPAGAGILSAYGADVVKVEPAGSADAARTILRLVDGEVIESCFEFSNNRKRSVQLNLSTPAGQAVMDRLLARADVFVTNVRARSLSHLHLDAQTVARRYPRLIYAHASGYGTTGPARDRAAFDELAYWSRAGMAQTLATDDNPPVQLHGAMGDLPSAVALVAGIMMALFRREREGEGGIVDASLYSSGMWTNALAIQDALLGVPPLWGRSRLYRRNPLYTIYRCADGRWVQFAMTQTDHYWEAVCEVVGRPDMIADPRFETHALRCANSEVAIVELQKGIGGRTLREWRPLFDERDLAWSPIFSPQDIARDEQARANGYILPKTYRTGRPMETIAPPFQLRGVPLEIGPAPEAGQHTEEVLLELGYDWDQIADLRAQGAF